MIIALILNQWYGLNVIKHLLDILFDLSLFLLFQCDCLIIFLCCSKNFIQFIPFFLSFLKKNHFLNFLIYLFLAFSFSLKHLSQLIFHCICKYYWFLEFFLCFSSLFQPFMCLLLPFSNQITMVLEIPHSVFIPISIHLL